jgi:hypothetical protein
MHRTKPIKHTLIFILLSIAYIYIEVPLANECTEKYTATTNLALNKFAVVTDSIPSSVWEKETIYIFHPDNMNNKYPVVFFFHCYGSSNPNEYESFVNHIVSQGYVIIYPPYRRISLMRNQTLKYSMFFSGVEEAVRTHESIIDTSKISCIGHGFGAGAIPALLKRYFTENKWESKSALLGNGNKDQTYMGEWYDAKPVRELVSTDYPKASHPELQYVFAWGNKLNPRNVKSKLVDLKIRLHCNKYS